MIFGDFSRFLQNFTTVLMIFRTDFQNWFSEQIFEPKTSNFWVFSTRGAPIDKYCYYKTWYHMAILLLFVFLHTCRCGGWMNISTVNVSTCDYFHLWIFHHMKFQPKIVFNRKYFLMWIFHPCLDTNRQVLWLLISHGSINAFRLSADLPLWRVNE